MPELHVLFYWSPFHRFTDKTDPPRYVVRNIDVGWCPCEVCGRQGRIWVTCDTLWKALPRRYWKRVLCPRCWRAKTQPAARARALRKSLAR